MSQQRRRPTSREAARFRAQNQPVPMYVHVDMSSGTVTGTDGGSSVSCDTGSSSSSSGGYDSGSSSSFSYDSGSSSYSSGGYDSGSSSSSCDSGGGF